MRKSSRGNPYHDEIGRFCSAARATGAFVGDQDIDLKGMSEDEKRETVKRYAAGEQEYYDTQTHYREFIKAFFGEASMEEELKAYSEFSKSDREAYQECIDNEQRITKDMEEHCNLVGKSFRLKSPTSIRGKQSRKGGEVSHFWDVIRYTHQSDEQHLMGETKQILSDLESKGYTVCTFKNTWNDDTNPYNGINVKMLSPDRQRFELQFHTEASFCLKNGEMHKMYEVQRAIEENDPNFKDNPAWKNMNEEMTKLGKTLKRPKNISEKTKWEIR